MAVVCSMGVRSPEAGSPDVACEVSAASNDVGASFGAFWFCRGYSGRVEDRQTEGQDIGRRLVGKCYCGIDR